MLRHPSAEPTAAQLQDFVLRFPTGLKKEEAAKQIHRFLSVISDRILSESQVFAAAAKQEDGHVNALEGLEKLLLTKLHQKIFPIEAADAAEDARLYKLINSLAWVSFENLGIPPVDPDLISEAAGQLKGLDSYRAPRDKLVVLLNACRVINHILKRTVAERGASGRPLSADDFLPLLIYAVLVANPRRLHSNVEYIATFRHPSRLVAEDAYFLTALQSAVAFIRGAGPKELDVTLEEFERRCSMALASRSRSGSEGPTAATAAERAQQMEPEEAWRFRERLGALPLSFEGARCVTELRVGDVPTLLNEYRLMAALLRDVANSALL